MATRIMILAGGTGGHIFPALAVASELRERGCEVMWMGTHAGMEARLVPAAGIPIHWLSVAGFRGKNVLRKLTAPFKLIGACIQAARILLREKPQAVLGMGGFVAGPGGFMARLLGIPLLVHEQNRIPGTTNRILVKWAQVVLQAFPDCFPSALGALWVGNPLRKAIIESPAKSHFAPGNPLKLLVVGGSQGAKVLNQVVPQALAQTGSPVKVLHQTGADALAETQALYQSLAVDAQVVAFIDDMAGAYRWADLAICRAGAMTVSELMATSLPAVLVPFPYAIDDHQTANARYLADAGAAILMPQTELNPQHLAEVIQQLQRDPQRLSGMAEQAASLAKLDAAVVVAERCMQEARP